MTGVSDGRGPLDRTSCAQLLKQCKDGLGLGLQVALQEHWAQHIGDIMTGQPGMQVRFLMVKIDCYTHSGRSQGRSPARAQLSIHEHSCSLIVQLPGI